MNLKVTKDEDAEAASMETIKKRDPLYDSAIEVVIREGRGSCSPAPTLLGNRLWSRGKANRLHGRGWHCR